MPLWKQHHSGNSQPSLPLDPVAPSPVKPSPAKPPSVESLPRIRPVTSSDDSRLTREVVVRGQITGTDALFLDGLVEGSIEIANGRVIIGPNGCVHAPAGHAGPCITGREVVVMGQVEGSIYAGERLEIRANGSVTGDISTVRVSIEDGAFFRGGIDIRQPKKPGAEQSESSLAGAAV